MKSGPILNGATIYPLLIKYAIRARDIVVLPHPLFVPAIIKPFIIILLPLLDCHKFLKKIDHTFLKITYPIDCHIINFTRRSEEAVLEYCDERTTQ